MFRSTQLIHRGYSAFLKLNRIRGNNRYLSLLVPKEEREIKSVIHEQYSNTARNFDHDSKLQKENVTSIAKVFGYSVDELLEIGDGNMGLSCGNPVSQANIEKNEIVLDLGCGAGMDMFLALKYIGNNGKIIGIDMSQDMINKAINNANKRGINNNNNTNNMEFYLSEIEDMSAVINNDYIDCVISNCVLNLIPNKKKAFKEIHRILKPNGGRICLSDLALKQKLPEFIANDMNKYVSCISGAILAEEYMDLLYNAGFKHIEMINKNVDLNVWKQSGAGSCIETDNNAESGCCDPGDHPLNIFDEQEFAKMNLNDFIASYYIFGYKE